MRAVHSATLFVVSPITRPNSRTTLPLSIFLLKPPSAQIDLRSGFGHLALSDTLKSAAQASASEALAEMRPTRADSPTYARLAVPLRLRGGPVGAIVAHVTVPS